MCIRDRINDILRRCGGGEHPAFAHVLTAKTLWRHQNAHLIPRNNTGVDNCRGVIAGIDPAQRVFHDGTAQQAVQISLADTAVDRILEGFPSEMDLLPDLDETDRHAGVLADGNIQLLSGVQIALQIPQNFLGKRIALAFLKR